MPADLDRAFQELGSHTNVVTLPTAADVRQRSDRRRRGRVAGGLALAAVMLAVLTVSASATGILGTGRSVTPGLTPTQTAAPAPSPSVSATAPTPNGTATAPAAEPELTEVTIDLPPGCEDGVLPLWPLTYAGDALPQSVMLEGRDWGSCYGIYRDDAGYEVYQPDFSYPAPALCPASQPYPADEHRLAGRVRGFYGGPEIDGTQRVTRYTAGQAAAFMDQVRERVTQCGVGGEGSELRYTRILETGFAGDDSMLIFRGASATEESYPGVYQAVIRVGDLILIVIPYFDLGGDREYTLTMAQKAVATL